MIRFFPNSLFQRSCVRRVPTQFSSIKRARVLHLSDPATLSKFPEGKKTVTCYDCEDQVSTHMLNEISLLTIIG